MSSFDILVWKWTLKPNLTCTTLGLAFIVRYIIRINDVNLVNSYFISKIAKLRRVLACIVILFKELSEIGILLERRVSGERKPIFYN